MVKFKISVLIISENVDYYKSNVSNIVTSYYYRTPQDINLIYEKNIKDYTQLLTLLNDNKTIDAIIIDKKTDENTKKILENASTEISSLILKTDLIDNRYIQNIVIPFVFKEKHNSSILFSFYTCTFNTDPKKFLRLYSSILNQTYIHWNWYILDDSTDDNTIEMIKSLNDPRIFVYKNITHHANIGFNKHSIAMLCSGDWLIEVDHDDLLTKDCLQTIYDALQKFPKSKFIYSNAVELYEGTGEKFYGNDYEFSWCLGYYKTEKIEGNEKLIATTGPLNSITIRTILCAPNHVRCVEKNFYHKINGHNTKLSIMDDLDLIHRIFINCNGIEEITYIDKSLYIQDLIQEHTTEKTRGMVFISDISIFDRDDEAIHNKLVELNLPDPTWNERTKETCKNQQYIRRNRHLLPILCNIYNPNE